MSSGARQSGVRSTKEVVSQSREVTKRTRESGSLMLEEIWTVGSRGYLDRRQMISRTRQSGVRSSEGAVFPSPEIVKYERGSRSLILRKYGLSI
jgi:hypothetical protein